MRNQRFYAAAMILLAICTIVALAAGSAPQKPKDAPAQEVAIFSVPKLMEGTTLKSLAQALAKKPGIVSAEVNAEKGTFNVTFDPKKTSPDEILKTVASISKDAKLVAVVPAEGGAAMGSDCGKCPSARSCPKAKK
jgi:copper chaperone CopZ